MDGLSMDIFIYIGQPKKSTLTNVCHTVVFNETFWHFAIHVYGAGKDVLSILVPSILHCGS